MTKNELEKRLVEERVMFRHAIEDAIWDATPMDTSVDNISVKDIEWVDIDGSVLQRSRTDPSLFDSYIRVRFEVKGE